MKMEYKGGKKSKHRVTVAFFVNGVGECESLPIVIWKSKNPCCFEGVKRVFQLFIIAKQSVGCLGRFCMTSLGP